MKRMKLHLITYDSKFFKRKDFGFSVFFNIVYLLVSTNFYNFLYMVLVFKATSFFISQYKILIF